jgi:CHAT domain-containing protein/tetratricopeptide (TPR) repeat protein
MRETILLLSLALLIPISGSVRQSPFLPHPVFTNRKSAPPLVQQPEIQQWHYLATEKERTRDFGEAAAFLEHGIAMAHERQDRVSQIKLMTNLGNVQVKQLRYREALRTYLAAQRLARAEGDQNLAPVIAMSLSGVYYHLWAFEEAERFAADVAKMRVAVQPGWRARILLAQGRLALRRGRIEDGEKLMREGIAAAAGDPLLEAAGWETLGRLLMDHGRLDAAEEALLEAYRIRDERKDRDLFASLQTLGSLRIAQGEPRAALELTERALAEVSKARPIRPILHLHYDRARALHDLGRTVEAWQELKLTLDHLRGWRSHLLPAESVQQAAGAALQDIYKLFIRVSMEISSQPGHSAAVWDALRAAEETREFSFRHADAGAKALQLELPPGYGETLAKLQAAEARLAGGAGQDRDEVRRLRQRLGELEALHLNPNETPPLGMDAQSLGPQTLKRLRDDEAVLAFHLAAPHSYLWTLTREGLTSHQLAAGPELSQAVRNFRAAVERGSTDSTAEGAALYRALLGAAPAHVRAKRHWRVVPDGDLFEAPLAALVARHTEIGPVYLVEDHTLLLLTTAAGWGGRTAPPQRAGAMLLVADPVYSSADERVRPVWRDRLGHWMPAVFASAPAASRFELPRLAGSGLEASACAMAWRRAGGMAGVISGPDATGARIRSRLADGPAVLHIATHLVPDPASPGDVQMALSLTPRGEPELLGSDSVRAWRVPGSLVVLSGCSSGSGRSLPGQGRSGLTRAWLEAGASGVVGTHWPIVDSGGELLRQFYETLAASDASAEAVEIALQSAQTAMIRSATSHAKPVFWASFFVLGKK